MPPLRYPNPSKAVLTMSMLRCAESMRLIRVWYSLLALLPGTSSPVVDQLGFETWLFSPRSVNAMMLRVFDVVAVLLVIHTSTRLIFTPVIRLGIVDIALS